MRKTRIIIYYLIILTIQFTGIGYIASIPNQTIRIILWTLWILTTVALWMLYCFHTLTQRRN